MISISTIASNNHFHKAITAAIVGGAFLFSSVSATAQTSGVGTAVIDGTMSAGEWDGAGTVNFDIDLPEGGVTPATLFIMNDADDLYVAVRYARTFIDLPDNFLSIRIDADNDGSLTGVIGVTTRPPDDEYFQLLIAPPPSTGLFTDGFIVRNGWVGASGLTCTGVCTWPDELDTGFGTNDPDHPTVLGGAFTNDGGFSVYEMVHPLDSADSDHDINVSAGDIIGIQLIIRLGTPPPQTIFPVLPAADPSLDVQIAEAGANRILDFERLAHDFAYAVLEPSPYLEDGFTITAVPSSGTPYFQVIGSNYVSRYTGSTTLYVYTTPTTHTLTNDINNPFTLVSIDVSEIFVGGGTTASTGLITYTGTKTDTSIVTHSFELDLDFGPETFVFPPTFSDLESVSVEIDATGYQYHQIDNVVIEVESVPPDAVDDDATADCGAEEDIFVLDNDNFLVHAPFVVTAQTPTDKIGTTVVNGSPGPKAGIFVTYTSADGFDGEDTFTYTVTDNNGDSDTATVTVEVDGSTCPVEPGENQVIFDPDPDPTKSDESVTAVVQKVVKKGTIKQLSCVIEEDPGTAKAELDLVQKIKTTQDCIDKGVTAELKLTDKAKLKKYQRAFEDSNDGNKKKIVVTLIRSKNELGDPDDLTKGVVVSEEDATKQGVTEPPCIEDDVSQSPSTVGVNLSGNEPSLDKARNWTGTCNGTRSISRFSDQLLAFPIRNDSSIVAPHVQVNKEAGDFRLAVKAEQAAGCVDAANKGRFLRVVLGDFNRAMRLVNKGKFDEGICALQDVTLVALDPDDYDPYGECSNDPKGHFVSRLMDLTYQVHRGLRKPDTFELFPIDPRILCLLPRFPGEGPPSGCSPPPSLCPTPP